MTIKDWQTSVDTWIKDHGVRYYDEKTNALILVEEVGEFARIVAREYGEQSWKRPPGVDEVKKMLADELSDIVWVATCLANQMNIDLTSTLQENMLKKTNRDKERHHQNTKLK